MRYLYLLAWDIYSLYDRWGEYTSRAIAYIELIKKIWYLIKIEKMYIFYNLLYILYHFFENKTHIDDELIIITIVFFIGYYHFEILIVILIVQTLLKSFVYV